MSPNDPRGTSTRRSSAIFLSSLCTSSALSPAVDTPRSASAARRSATFIFAGDADAIAGELSGGGAPRSGVVPSSWLVPRYCRRNGCENLVRLPPPISDLPTRNLGREGTAFTVSENGPPPNCIWSSKSASFLLRSRLRRLAHTEARRTQARPVLLSSPFGPGRSPLDARCRPSPRSRCPARSRGDPR